MSTILKWYFVNGAEIPKDKHPTNNTFNWLLSGMDRSTWWYMSKSGLWLNGTTAKPDVTISNNPPEHLRMQVLLGAV